MRFLRLLPLAALVFAGACDKDAAVTNVARPPLAFIRYVNAVPDAPNNLDFKFMDDIEYSPSYANAGYRSVGIYQGARAGARPVKVFRNSSDINETQEELVSTTLNLTANTYYTILHMGYYSAANGTPAQALVVIEDTRPAQDAGLHVSAVNAYGTPRDVFVGTPAGTPLFSAIASGSRSAYAARATGTFTLHSTANASLVSNASATPIEGVAGTTTADPVGGWGQAGTQFSAFLFPGTPAGAAAAVSIVVDRQPPRTVPE